MGRTELSAMATDDQITELTNILGWIRTAKEILPTINEGAVAPDRIAQASALLDRLHRIAAALQADVAQARQRPAA
ncbi:MAG: hypothetical protein ABUL67_02385 [Haliangium ochraceum]